MTGSLNLSVVFKVAVEILRSEINFMRGKSKCSKTRHFSAKNVELISCSQLVNRNSMLKRVSQMNPSVAKPAEMQRRTQAEAENPLQLYAQNAAAKQRFLSSPTMTDLYIAVNVSQSREANNRFCVSLPFQQYLFRLTTFYSIQQR